MSAILKKKKMKIGFNFECKRWKGPVFTKSAISKKKQCYREGKNPNFCDYLRDAASGPKTFLGPN